MPITQCCHIFGVNTLLLEGLDLITNLARIKLMGGCHVVVFVGTVKLF